MPAIRQILLIGHTHHDVGYTNSPRLIDELHAEVVGEVLRLAADGPQAGPDALRWTFEVARPVLRFLARADDRARAELRRLVDAGRVSVTGGALNMTQLPSEWEFDTAYDALSALREAGIRVRTEQHGDVNGIAWGTVDGMRRAGIERLVMALNPDHGRPPFTQPTGFWWQGVAGERVFVWLSTHYGFGEEWGIVDADTERAERRIREFIEALEARDDYPYDTAMVHAGNDNRWPTALFTEVVRVWNARHPERPMRTATVDEALDVLQAQAGAAGEAVPTVRGEWSDWWSHGHGSTAREVAVYREARAFALSGAATFALARLRGDGAPAMATVMGYRRGPVRLRSDAEIERDLARVDEQLLLFGEHTWGSWETYSKPFSNLSHSHWNAKAAMAYEAYDWARDLAIEGVFRLAASGGPAAGAEPAGAPPADLDAGHRDPVTAGHDAPPAEVLLVVNPTERERTEPVSAEIGGARRVRAVATVPAFGAVALPVPCAAPASATREADEVAFDGWRVVVDAARGGLRSLVTPQGRELVDGAVPHGFSAIVTETVEAGSDHPMVTRSPKDFHPDFPGPVFEVDHAMGQETATVVEHGDTLEVSWRSTPRGLPEATTTLVLHRGIPTVELEVALVKPESFGPESIFVAFPFAGAGTGAAPEFLLETAGAVYAAGEEQLPDTSQDWFSIQHAIGVNTDDGGILWTTADAPLVQLGGFHTGRWARRLQPTGGHVNSWLMNNLHFTNFQARQEGTRRYRYRFEAVDGPVTRERVRRAGRDALVPLQARGYTGPQNGVGLSGLRVRALDERQADAVLTELRPLPDGTVRLRLRGITAESVRVAVGWDGPGRADGGVVAEPGGVEVPPFGRVDVVLRRRG